ncbi:MAG: inovirus-type Gp2 protein [Lentisphaeria bacterium]|nr:inovirus-type Gp2 protein [Lentisphaeria bacterium]
MKRENKETTEITYHNYPIMTDKERGLSCDTKILNEIERQFNYAEETKNKIFFMRYDIRFPEGYDHADNGVFREFQSKFMKNLSRKGLKPQYVAVREQSREKHQHYHVALILDGQKTQSIYNHIQTAERLWDSTLGLPEKKNGYGLIDDCTRSRAGETQVNGVVLRYDDPWRDDKKLDCFRRASYLAKTNTKGNTPKGQRELFSSRIVSDNKKMS